jgi:bacteriocin-like protein
MNEKNENQVRELSKDEMKKVEGGMIGAGVYGDGAPYKALPTQFSSTTDRVVAY